MTTGKDIAATTLSQLGGTSRLSLMAGAKHFSYSKTGTVSMALGRNPKRVTHVSIELNGSDLYDVRFLNISTRRRPEEMTREVSKVEDVYAENLVEVFERGTGLFLRIERRAS